MIKRLLLTNCGDEGVLQRGGGYFFWERKIVTEETVALRFFRKRDETELFDFFHQPPGDSNDIHVEEGMLGDGTMPHFKDDLLHRAARLVHFLCCDSP